MSQETQKPDVPQMVPNKQIVIVVSRFGQVVGVYNRLDDCLVIIQDYIVKGLTFDLSAKYVQ